MYGNNALEILLLEKSFEIDEVGCIRSGISDKSDEKGVQRLLVYSVKLASLVIRSQVPQSFTADEKELSTELLCGVLEI